MEQFLASAHPQMTTLVYPLGQRITRAACCLVFVSFAAVRRAVYLVRSMASRRQIRVSACLKLPSAYHWHV